MSHYVIGLDLGTTTIKAVALDSRNRVMATASSSHSMTSPEAGWAVENLQDIGDGVIKVLKEISSQVPPREIAGICLSGAMHSLCPIDREFSPLAPAMTWADNRSAEIARKLRKDIADDNLLLKVGCPLQNVYHPARLRWWLESEPAIVKKTAYFVSIKDWIIYQLTRKLVIDYGLASTTGLLDIQALEWEKEAFDLSGITRRKCGWTDQAGGSSHRTSFRNSNYCWYQRWGNG
jgi:gluconokinase